ncbi:MAG: hypothetical protein GEU98_23890 [Pseudonocardiaceae bacterium]|nr:hypothetical protein [Pseudonocardiaceae bacterium]
MSWTVQRWDSVFTQQAGRFRAAVASTGLDTAVPTSPGWTFRDLVLRAGRFAHQVTRYLTTASRVMLRPVPIPDGDPVSYLDEHVAGLADALADTPANRPLWTFSPAAPDLAWVWHRRVAHEFNLRRWEAQAALNTLEPTDRALAVDGIDETLRTLLPAKYAAENPVAITGTAVLSSDDGPESWQVTFHPGEVPYARIAAPGEHADAWLTSSAANLLYHLRDRTSLAGTGNHDILRAVIVE